MGVFWQTFRKTLKLKYKVQFSSGENDEYKFGNILVLLRNYILNRLFENLTIHTSTHQTEPSHLTKFNCTFDETFRYKPNLEHTWTSHGENLFLKLGFVSKQFYDKISFFPNLHREKDERILIVSASLLNVIRDFIYKNRVAFCAIIVI